MTKLNRSSTRYTYSHAHITDLNIRVMVKTNTIHTHTCKPSRMQTCAACTLTYTVESRLTTTLLRRPPRYYNHFKKSQTTYHMFPCKKLSQRPPRYSELRPLFSAQMQFLTPELRPLTFCGRIFSRKCEFSSLVCFVWRQIS